MGAFLMSQPLQLRKFTKYINKSMRIKLLMEHPLTNTEYWQTCHIYLISVKLLIPNFQEDKNARTMQLPKFQDDKKTNCFPNMPN